MPKSTKVSRDAPTAEEIQKLYARAYGSRLAKQVAQVLDNTRRSPAPRKKRDAKA